MNTGSPKLSSFNKRSVIVAKKAFQPERLSLLQKSYGTYKPVNGFNRFRKSIIVDSGEDPNKAYVQFINRDLIQPLKRPTITEPSYIPDSPLKWTVGCTKKCNSPDLLPKKQQYIDVTYHKSNDSNYNKYYLQTDNISVKIPSEMSKSSDQCPFLNMKAKYGAHSESKQGWVPREYTHTVANRGSVPYNIINYTNNPVIGTKSSDMMNRTLNNKKKGVAAFSDYTRPSFPNFNKEYQQLLTENKNIFHNYNGIFSNLYDLAKKNGNIYIPFRRNYNDGKDKQGIKKTYDY